MRWYLVALINFLIPLALATGCAFTKDFSWVAIGDWGQPGKQQRSVVDRMAIEAANISAQFALLLGDNFYPNGVSTWMDDQFVSTYENVFVASSLQIPHFAVLGNHDYHQNPEAQVGRHHNTTSRWTMPGRWYSREFTIHCQSQKITDVLFVFIDTMMLSEGGGNDHMTMEQRQEHWSWLQKVLGEATADWSIVVGHHPVYSNGRHGDTTQLVNELKPLLDCHGVDAYFAGHDHDLQMLSDGQDSPLYIISGSGSKLRIRSRGYHRQAQFAESLPGFVSTRLNGTHIYNSWISDAGVLLHEHVQPRRKKHIHKSCRPAVVPSMDGQFYFWMEVAVAVVLVLSCLATSFLIRRRLKRLGGFESMKETANQDLGDTDRAKIYGAGVRDSL